MPEPVIMVVVVAPISIPAAKTTITNFVDNFNI
jgi:hypothetical protein